jgi:hypothetical protein
MELNFFKLQPYLEQNSLDIQEKLSFRRRFSDIATDYVPPKISVPILVPCPAAACTWLEGQVVTSNVFIRSHFVHEAHLDCLTHIGREFGAALIHGDSGVNARPPGLQELHLENLTRERTNDQA